MNILLRLDAYELRRLQCIVVLLIDKCGNFLDKPLGHFRYQSITRWFTEHLHRMLGPLPSGTLHIEIEPTYTTLQTLCRLFVYAYSRRNSNDYGRVLAPFSASQLIDWIPRCSGFCGLFANVPSDKIGTVWCAIWPTINDPDHKHGEVGPQHTRLKRVHLNPHIVISCCVRRL